MFRVSMKLSTFDSAPTHMPFFLLPIKLRYFYNRRRLPICCHPIWDVQNFQSTVNYLRFYYSPFHQEIEICGPFTLVPPSELRPRRMLLIFCFLSVIIPHYVIDQNGPRPGPIAPVETSLFLTRFFAKCVPIHSSHDVIN